MNIDATITKRFEELIAQGREVLDTKRKVSYYTFVDNLQSEQWGVSTLNFLGRSMGQNSEHYKKFSSYSTKISDHSTTEKCFAVLASAYEDFKGGYLFDVRKSITADVFADFIEQAEYLLKEGYFQVAAVIAGSVLEDSLRRLCAQHGVPLSAKPKLSGMNDELAKVGIYNKLVQKKVTWLADIRNKAAHGLWNEFTNNDADEMVRLVRRFVEDYLP